ncbi:MAG: Shedu immune nuclease family protein [Chloroflexota bacterium]
MNKVVTKRTSSATAEVTKDYELSQTGTTRKVFKAIILDNPRNSQASVKGFLIHQRKLKEDLWETICDKKLSSLKSGEGIKIELNSETLLNLYECLCMFYSIGKSGIKDGIQEYNLISNEELTNYIEVPKTRKDLIKKLLDQEHSEEIWDAIVSSDPDLATRLSWAKIQIDRNNALKEFEENINNKELHEKYWQKFFSENTWIFGYGLNYIFTNIFQEQPNYGGGSVDNKGDQRGDYLCHTSANNRFTVLVEIKKPNTELIDRPYRNGCYLLEQELYGAVSQLQANLNTWNIGDSRSRKNVKKLEDNNIYTCQPKGILIIGNTAKFKNDDERTSFELFRRNIYNPEIITFDELLERAKFIVGYIENRSKPCDIDTDEDEEVPF